MIDKEYFWEQYPKHFKQPTQSQKDGINYIIDGFDNDPSMELLSWLAYELATVKHETANTFKPIREIGRGVGRPYGKATTNGHVYYGRGYVQLTWWYNYKTIGDKIGVDLYNNPDLALQPDIAVKIMNEGMKYGIFTGKKFADYLTEHGNDWISARKIINGTDKNVLIGSYAEKFYDCLRVKE